jgi:hypothetical protein
LKQTCRLETGCQRLADRQAERLRGEHADRQIDLEEGKRTCRLRKRQVIGQAGSQEEGMQTDRQTGLEEGVQAGRLTEWKEWAGNRGQGWEVWVGIQMGRVGKSGRGTCGQGWEVYIGNRLAEWEEMTENK